MLSFLLIVPLTSSAATNKKQQTDSCLSKVLGDSLSNIITSEKTTKAYIWKNENGKDIKAEVKRLNQKERHLLRFILTNPLMTKTNNIVYGKFTPCIGFEIKKSKTQKVYINIDLGLGKWSISDYKGKELKLYDIEGYDLLRLSAWLYPSDTFITGIYNNRLNK